MSSTMNSIKIYRSFFPVLSDSNAIYLSIREQCRSSKHVCLTVEANSNNLSYVSIIRVSNWYLKLFIVIPAVSFNPLLAAVLRSL